MQRTVSPGASNAKRGQLGSAHRYSLRRQSSAAALLPGNSHNNHNGHHPVTRPSIAYSSAPGGSHYQFRGDDEGDESRQSGLLATCLAPLKWLHQKLFLDLREEDDDFDTILRKIVISAGVPLVIFPVAFAVYLAGEISSVGITTGGLVTLLVMFVFPLVWIPSFLYVNYTKTVNDVLLDIWLIVTTLGVLVLSLSLIEYPTPQLAFFLLVMALLCQTPRLPLHVLLCGVVYSISMLNQAFSGFNPASEVKLAAVPDPYRGSMLERVAYQVTGLVIGGIIAAAVIMQTRENARMMGIAANAAVIAREVANQLATYDTDSAKDTLVGFAKSGEADPDLVFAFHAIVENLELYRPHLPQWIMQAHENEREALRTQAAEAGYHFDFAGAHVASPGDDGLDSPSPDGLGETKSGPTRRGGFGARRGGAPKVRGLATDRDLDLEVDIRVESVSTSPQNSDLGTSPTGSPRHGGSTGGGSGNSGGHPPYSSNHHHSNSGRQFYPSKSSPTDANGNPTRTPVVSSLLSAAAQRPFYGKATFAMLHVDMRLTPAEAMGVTYDQTIEAICDRLQEVAAATHGVVHSVAGDTVLMSWNAVQRTAAYETKAAKALAQLAIWSGAQSAVVAGFAMSDVIRAHHYGSRQKLFGARIPFKQVLWAVSLYARDRETLLVDDVAYRLGSGDVEMFPADTLRVAEWRAVDQQQHGLTPMMSPKHLKASTASTSGPFGGGPNSSTHTAAPTPASGGGNNNNGGNSPNPVNLLGLSQSQIYFVDGSGFRLLNVYEVVKEHGAASPGDPFNVSSTVAPGTHDGTAHPNQPVPASAAANTSSSSHGGHGGHGDEWMYVLQRRTRRRNSGTTNTSDVGDPVETALALCNAGRYSEALDIVNTYVKPAVASALESPDRTSPHEEYHPTNGTNSSESQRANNNRRRDSDHADVTAGDAPPLPHLSTSGSPVALGDNSPTSYNYIRHSSSFQGAYHGPRALIRLKERLEYLIATKAGSEAFPTPCVLSYTPAPRRSHSGLLLTSPPSAVLLKRGSSATVNYTPGSS